MANENEEMKNSTNLPAADAEVPATPKRRGRPPKKQVEASVVTAAPAIENTPAETAVQAEAPVKSTRGRKPKAAAAPAVENTVEANAPAAVIEAPAPVQ